MGLRETLNRHPGITTIGTALIIVLALVFLFRMPTQYSASTVFVISMLLLVQIHDELILEFPPQEEAALRSLIVEEMTTAVPLRVPLKVDLHTGANWAECEGD